jgi:hypothetical protein
MIKRINGKYVVLSETMVRGPHHRPVRRKFGMYATREQAEHRLRQIEFFKRLKEAGKKKKP